jgi:AraC-like DNA-binding protein
MTYFGQVKGWQRWKPWSAALGVPVGVMVAAKAVEAWADVTVMPEQLAWWLTVTVGAVCLRYCLGAMHRVWLWMKPLGEDYYSNPDDLPLEYARQVMPIPVLHGVAAWTAFLIGNAAVTAGVMALLSVFNVWFLILALPTHRHREDPVADVSEDVLPDLSEDTLLASNDTSTKAPGGASDSAQKPLPRETVSRIKQQLQQYVETEEHFLDPHLTLSDVLAGGCTYNRSYVSRVLNEEMGCTFSAYVNRLRLQRADDLHRQEPQAHIGDIIARSGFDSPSNYYKAKRKYGEE